MRSTVGIPVCLRPGGCQWTLSNTAGAKATSRSVGSCCWKRMAALLLDLENLIHPSFVIEAYRTVEREHGAPPEACFAFGSPVHAARAKEVTAHFGIEVLQTDFGVKNAADKELMRVAKQLWPHRTDNIVVGSGDRGFLKWFRPLRAEGLRLECVARDHQICKEAQSSYDALYSMDSKRMSLPDTAALRRAVIDSIPEIEKGPVFIDYATAKLRSNRIVPRTKPGLAFYTRHADVFEILPGGSLIQLQ